MLRAPAISSLLERESPPLAAQAAHGHQNCIVIVEDDADLAKLLRYNFEAAGYEVVCVTNGSAALERLEAALPALVLVDWGIPTLSGLELVRQLRRRESTQALPVVMLTGRCSNEERALALATGVDIFIGKPFSLAELMAAVAGLLSSRGGSLV